MDRRIVYRTKTGKVRLHIAGHAVRFERHLRRADRQGAASLHSARAAGPTWERHVAMTRHVAVRVASAKPSSHGAGLTAAPPLPGADSGETE
jgi:hypothetical protein